MKDAATAVRPPIGRGPIRRALASVRRGLKHAVWAVRGVTISNPPLPAEVRSILFVCKGNICRSPFAAIRAQALADATSRGIRCSSAGLRPSPDGRCPSIAVTAARRFGVSLSRHTPVAIDNEMMKEHDLIVVMEADQVAAVRRNWPRHQKPIVLLALFDPGPDGPLDSIERVNIPDPFGRDAAEFDRCYRRLDASVRELVSSIPSISAER